VEIVAKRGRPDVILHIRRLADIENHNVVPNLYKLYSVSVIYHLSVSEISGWYEAPFQQTFQDGVSLTGQDQVSNSEETELLSELPKAGATHVLRGIKRWASMRMVSEN
jgi:hypothetical protein